MQFYFHGDGMECLTGRLPHLCCSGQGGSGAKGSVATVAAEAGRVHLVTDRSDVRRSQELPTRPSAIIKLMAVITLAPAGCHRCDRELGPVPIGWTAG